MQHLLATIFTAFSDVSSCRNSTICRTWEREYRHLTQHSRTSSRHLERFSWEAFSLGNLSNHGSLWDNTRRTAMLRGALAQHRGFSRESPNNVFVRFFSLGGFSITVGFQYCGSSTSVQVSAVGHVEEHRACFFCHLSYILVSTQLAYWQIC